MPAEQFVGQKVSTLDARTVPMQQSGGAQWDCLPADITARLVTGRYQLNKATLRLLNKHWRYSIDRSVAELTIDRKRLRRAGVTPSAALSIAERRFATVSVLRCRCSKEEDWLEHICSGPLCKIKALTLAEDLGRQSFENLSHCEALQRLHIYGTNLGQQQFHHLSGIKALHTLDMKGASISNHTIATFSRLSKLKAGDLGSQG